MEVEKPIYIDKVVEVPEDVEKEVYVEKPVYIENVIEIPVENVVEVEKPVNKTYYCEI